MWELKTHEIIENTEILQRLKERMHSHQVDSGVWLAHISHGNSLQVYNKLVCNCHEDSELLSIIDLVESIYSALDSTSRTFYWQRLQAEIYPFMEDFDHHMREEESVFQPLLNQYFNYDELVQIQTNVTAQHSERKEWVEAEKSLKKLKRGRPEEEEDVRVAEVPVKSCREASPAESLPRWHTPLPPPAVAPHSSPLLLLQGGGGGDPGLAGGPPGPGQGL
jgi:F-box/leucine-rich repeat protein 5